MNEENKMQNKNLRYKSCFIIEVVDKPNSIELIDSTGMYYIIDKNNVEVFSIFKNWFDNMFMLAKPQSLTIITYILNDISECEFENSVQSLNWYNI